MAQGWKMVLGSNQMLGRGPSLCSWHIFHFDLHSVHFYLVVSASLDPSMTQTYSCHDLWDVLLIPSCPSL